MEVKQFLNEGKILVREENYVIIKSKIMVDNAFAVINDGSEITIIIEQWKGTHEIKADDCIAIERDWKIITFDMVLPFELVGFISTIAQALANSNISIFVISTFSTDHILVKNSDLSKTIEILKDLGIQYKD